MILKKIHVILLQSASMCLVIIGPTTQKPTLVSIVVVCSNIGPRTILQLWKLLCWANIWPMSASQQWRVANNSNHYPTWARRLFATCGSSLLYHHTIKVCVYYTIHRRTIALSIVITISRHQLQYMTLSWFHNRTYYHN